MTSPTIGQLAHNRSSVTVIASESGATRNIFFISQVLREERSAVVALLVVHTEIEEGEALHLRGVGGIVVTLSDITETAADTEALQRRIRLPNGDSNTHGNANRMRLQKNTGLSEKPVAGRNARHKYIVPACPRCPGASHNRDRF